MKRGSFSQKTISVLLSLIMVFSMVPVFTIASVAEDAASSAVQSSGSWSSTENYATMSVSPTAYTFMQTSDDQTFSFSLTLTAKKNSSVNYVVLDTVSFSGMTPDSQSWDSSPDGDGLGTSSSTYTFNASFTGEGATTYSASLDIAFTNGITSFSTSSATYNVPITIEVVDLRMLNKLLANAEDSIANDASMSDSAKTALQATVDDINANYILDGSVYYSQETVDELCSKLAIESVSAVSGEWEHKIVTEGTYAGYGEYYVSMWIKNTDFVFMQMTDDQQFTFNYEYWAVKNDGVNYAKISHAEFDGNMPSLTTAWSGIQNGGDTPVGATLPGSLGSGHSKQIANNIDKWNFAGTFTANGNNTYTGTLDVTYKSGSTSFNTSSHSLSADDEVVDFTVTVVDMRELLAKVSSAQEAVTSDEFSTIEQANIQKVLDYLSANYTLDGTVCYSQTTVNQLCSLLEWVTGADLAAYREAVEKAQEIVNSAQYTDAQKETLNTLLAKKETILAMTRSQQSDIDAATDELNAAIDALETAMNGVTPDQPEGTATFTFVSSKDNTSTNADSVIIEISSADVYMDISESFSDLGVTYSYSSNFGNDLYVASPITNSLATTSKIAGNDNLYNFSSYINDCEITSSDEEKVGTGDNSEHNVKLYMEYTLTGGTPIAVTSDEGVKAYVGAYWKQYKSGYKGYSRYSYDGDIFSGADSSEASENQPYITLHVYDKSSLAEAIESAEQAELNGAVNFSDCLDALSAAKEVYGRRVTTQTEIDSAAQALNDIVFYYQVTAASADETAGSVTVTLASGSQSDSYSDAYTIDTVLTLTAEPTDDYEFTSWSDGTSQATYTYTVSGNAALTASFTFVEADTSSLKNALADIPEIAEEDEYKYDADTLQALKDAKEAAEALVNADPALGKSSQDEIDAAESTLRAAIDGLVKTTGDPCDYTLLDEAIAAADAILAELPENDGRYKDDAWNALLQALENANAVDRDLTDIDPANQQIITDAALALAEAISALGEAENQNGKVDTTELQKVVDDAQEKYTDTNSGQYNNDVWEAYQEAEKAAQDIIDNPPYDDDGGVNEAEVEKVKQALEDAIAALEDPANQNDKVDTTELQKVVDDAQEKYTDTNSGQYNNDVWEAYQEAEKAAQDILDNPPYDDDDGVNKAEVEKVQKALEDAIAALENPDNQNTLLDLSELQTAIDNAEAAYPNNDDNKYKSEAWDAYVAAKEQAEAFIAEQPYDDDDGVNAERLAEILQALNDAIAALEDTANQNDKVDTTELENTKNSAEETYGDTNDGKYTDEAWQEYIEAVEAAEEIINNPPYNDESGNNEKAVEDAKNRITAAVEALENTANQNFAITVTDANGNTTQTVYVSNSGTETFASVKDKITDATPADDNHAFAGWTDSDGNEITDDTVITGDMTIKPTFELSKILPNDTSSLIVDRETETEYTYMVGLDTSKNTAADIKAELENDEVQIIITRNDVELSDTDYVGTNCIVKCISVKDPTVVYEVATVILYGDVDGDGLVNDTDRTMLSNTAFFGGSDIASGTVFYIAADLDGDTVLDGFDYFYQDGIITGGRAFDQSVTLYK